MKLKKFTPDYNRVISYLLLFFCYFIFNQLEGGVAPYSISLFIVSYIGRFNLFSSAILFCLSFLPTGSFGLLPSALIASAFFILVILIYKKCNATPKYELILFSAISTIAYILLGDTVNFIPLEHRIAQSIFIVTLTFISYVFTCAVVNKGLKNKFRYEEFASAGILLILLGIGVSNAITPYLWKGISAFLIVLIAFIYRRGVCTVVSALLGCSLAVYYGNINYVSAFILMAVASESLIGFSRYFSALAITLIDYLAEVLFGVYGAYQLIDFLSVFLGVAIICILPLKPLKRLKDKLNLFREKQLVRVAINHNRTILSNRLYELSTVFTEMAQAFFSFNQVGLTPERAKTVITNNLCEGVCKECKNSDKCKRKSEQINLGVFKLIDIGFAKGKLSLIDLPPELTENCLYPNNLLFSLNKLLAEYRQVSLDNQNVDTGRKLIAEQADDVSNILRELALDSGTTLRYHAKLEHALSEKLMQNGINVCELLIYGEKNNFSIGMVICMKEFMLDKIIKIIKQVLNQNVDLFEQYNITQDKCYLSFRKAVPYDVIYGLAINKKDGSAKSGDTHSVTRITDDRFLVALSDGMGSGENANTVSSVSLSLIESFYKAGMQSELILNTVSRLMAISTEENFTALDLSVIDLKTCSADFIKYGAPYGFILSQNGIRIVEGSSIPLGILDHLKPSVCTTSLNDNDMLLLVTDGISDSFSSQGELIDFLKTLPALNPQTLCDSIMNKALSKTDGKKKDDMTVLAVRIFKKVS